jgi:hypothetical protein
MYQWTGLPGKPHLGRADFAGKGFRGTIWLVMTLGNSASLWYLTSLAISFRDIKLKGGEIGSETTEQIHRGIEV